MTHQTPFQLALALTLEFEGGFTNDPRDPGNWTGGAVGKGVCKGTKFGISAAAFPTLDVAALTSDDAASIYQALYWAKAQCDLMPVALAFLVFDAAVNSGVFNAVRFLQQALGFGTSGFINIGVLDGCFGPATLRAVQAAAGSGSGFVGLLNSYSDRRISFLRTLKTFAAFGAGWVKRVNELLADAKNFQQTGQLAIGS